MTEALEQVKPVIEFNLTLDRNNNRAIAVHKINGSISDVDPIDIAELKTRVEQAYEAMKYMDDVECILRTILSGTPF